VATRLEGALDRALAEDRQRAGRGRDDDVGLRQVGRNLLERDRVVSPAPISSAVLSPSSPKIWRARLTAANATDTGLDPISVSVRTCLATEKVCWNRRLSSPPRVPAELAAW
jgi:hypothetical protein